MFLFAIVCCLSDGIIADFVTLFLQILSIYLIALL